MVLPLFLAIVFAVFLFGWTQHNYSSLRFGLQQAARSLLLNQSLDAVRAADHRAQQDAGTAAPTRRSSCRSTDQRGQVGHSDRGLCGPVEVPLSFPLRRLTDTVVEQPLP